MRFSRNILASAAALSLITLLTIQAQPPRGQRPRTDPEQKDAPKDQAAPVSRSLQPRVFSITGARIVQEPGQVIATGTVVVRDGLIETVGDSVDVPSDALRIDGKGLTVYPGLIDGLSNFGFDPAL